MKRLFLLVFVILLLTACGSEAVIEPAATAVPTPTTVIIQPTDPAPPPPTAVPTQPSEPTTAAVQEEATSLPDPTTAPPTAVPAAEIVYGRTAEGAFFHGAADAPVTLIDYSDFL